MMHRFQLFWDQFLVSQENLMSMVMLPVIAKAIPWGNGDKTEKISCMQNAYYVRFSIETILS